MTRSEPLPNLLHHARDGDAEAWERIVASYRPRLDALVRRLATPRLLRRVPAEDLVQEVLLAAWRGLAAARFASTGAFEAWLVRVSRHRIVDLEREGRSAKRGGDEEREVADLSAVEDLARTTGTPSRVARRREDRRGLAAVLDRLPVAYREVLVLVRIEGRPTTEVAERLDLAPATVRKRLERALALCRGVVASPSFDGLADTRTGR